MGRRRRIAGGRSVLVIGYGNMLRRDDGVGPRAAEVVSGWRMPGVEAVVVHQLVPELAESLAAVDLAIFVDARHCREHDPVSVERARPATGRGEPLGHVGNPAALLALASAAYGGCPAAWIVSIPAVDLGLGEGLSPAAAAGLAEALGLIGQLIGTGRVPVGVDSGQMGGAPCMRSR